LLYGGFKPRDTPLVDGDETPKRIGETKMANFYGSVVVGFSGMYLAENGCWTTNVTRSLLFFDRADWFATAKEFEGIPAIIEMHDSRRTVQLFDLTGREELSVNRNLNYLTKTMEAATVNWKACGSVSVERATEYARLLTLGAKIAERL
jgi:hypothetical protein